MILYDDFNSVIPKKQDVIGTITAQFGNLAPRHGWKIIEYEKDKEHTDKD